MNSFTGDWTAAPLAALDLEGSGAQDHDNEAILEIAVVRRISGHIIVGHNIGVDWRRPDSLFDLAP
ncbi:MAG TPA: hypothetical protein VFX25_01820 [Streptosporangiaceae bacterium]|nr:hypothetical protein [Streptosporangiaceae bacterium]